MELKCCILNGELVGTEQPVSFLNNRAFRLGDSVFESIRVFKGGQVPWLPFHIERLKTAMSTIKIQIPPFFSVEYFQNQIKLLYEKNQLSGHARLRITVFREGKGNYIPETRSCSFVMKMETLEEGFCLNKEGYWVEIYPEEKKTINKYSSFKTGSALFYVMAGIFCSHTGIDECLLVNDHGNICESLQSNVFLVKGEYLITPPLSEGPVRGTMREVILNLAEKNKWIVLQQPVTVHHIYESEEMFLTNAIQGIRWVYKFRNKFFSVSRTNEIFASLCREFNGLV